jgi:hypothetical protein
MFSISCPAGFKFALRSLHHQTTVTRLLRLASTTASTLSEILTLLFATKPSSDIDYPSPTHLTCSKQISASQNGKSGSTTLSRTESVTYEATHSPALLPPFRYATSPPASHSSHRSHRATANPVVISCSSGRGVALTFRKVGRAEIAIRFGTNGNSLNCLRLKFKSFTILSVAGAEWAHKTNT